MGFPIRDFYRSVVGRSPPWTPLHLCHRAIDRYVGGQASKVLDGVGGSAVRVLDVGCGDMPYRKFFDRDGRCAAYDGADIAGAQSQATVEIDPFTQAISAPSGSYDLVISFQVLEHVHRPMELLRECHRVLRPGGALMLTLPFVYEYHAVPRDFRRWTHEGITDDLEVAGYGDIAVEPIETDLHSLLVIGQLYLTRYFGYVMTKPLFLTLNSAALAAERLKTSHQLRIIPLTLGATARKPA
jgi:SAM-dependent methyltransferase